MQPYAPNWQRTQQPASGPPYLPQPYEQGHGQPQHVQPQYVQPQFVQPQYGQPQFGQPQYAQPQYGQPQYAQPQYAPAPYGYQPPPIIIQNAVNVGGPQVRRRHGILFHTFMFFITGGLWLFIAPLLALRKRDRGASNSVSFR